MAGFFNAEQTEAAMRDMAAMMKTYFNELRMQGFTEEQALAMTNALQHSIITQPGGK